MPRAVPPSHWFGFATCSALLGGIALGKRRLLLPRRAQGVSFRQIASELNALGFTARRGGTFNQKQVQRLYERLPVADKRRVSE
jgi:hypothetical protein